MNKSLGALLIVLAAGGSLGGCHSHGGEHEHGETPVAMESLPAAVRATLDRESRGGKVDEVEKEMKNGKTVYSADVTVNGTAWDIAVAEDGTVISKEKEADEKDEKDEGKK